ncbi:peptide deformylase [Enterobacteriaceae endosymbiont of Neohaemonia nigricornis]|uniref:peptide deformylase n=1 Tax=Enterobacteriaceae endosymbiont of Neohaemonia nigricornis TaxID=2675792 RepID=UPI001448F3FE|nr:peptide deformylase [Enterobacteriaceae endosymbiont of Neohaemonia nigricornis]QJC30442.1 peptide deformylase [Enterobacteriaceae endosymbiont of Neohaemonia nigricornis]
MKLIYFPNNQLRVHAKIINNIDKKIHYLSQKMLDIMYKEGGIGLAATQIGIHKRIIVTDISLKQNKPCVYINPEIISYTSNKINSLEGCLSIPKQRYYVLRHKKIKISAFNLQNKKIEIELENLLSCCIQHEIDHLNGILFIDYLSNIKYQRIYDKLNKILNK